MEHVLVQPRALRAVPYETLEPGVPVLLRIDANIPWHASDRMLDDGGKQGKIAQSMGEIQKLIKKKAKVVLLTHWGDAHGKQDAQWSTRRLVPLFEKYLKKTVTHIPALFGEEVRTAIAQAKPGEVLILENMRFSRAEEKDDDALAKALAVPFTLFVNNALSVAHRAHASVHAITRYLPAYAGSLLIQEFARFTEPVQTPFVCIVGGAKIETKVALLERLGVHADTLMLGGGVAIAVQIAKGEDAPGVSGSFRRKEVLAGARRVLHRFEGKILLPSDAITEKKEGRIIDIGKETQKRYATVLASAKTVLWNGPVGVIEEEGGREGTRVLAQALKKSKAKVFVGGGDTVTFLAKEKSIGASWCVATGGGAMLALVAGERMPGLEPLWEV